MTTRGVVAAMVVLVGVLAGCGPGKVPGRVVRIIQEAQDTASVFSVPAAWAGDARGVDEVAWLRPGTLLMRDETALPYQSSDGDTLRLEVSKWRIMMDGRVAMLQSADDDALPWLERATPAELRGLRFLGEGDFPLDALRRLADVNPHVGLMLENRETVADVLSLLRPRWLSLGDDIDSIAGPLASQRDVEILWTSASDSASLAAIRALPKLRDLVLSEWAPPYAGVLPDRLEALWLPESSVDAEALAGLGSLRTLVLSRSDWNGPLELAEFKRLQWFGFPKNANQVDFSAMVQAHPKLEVVELLEMNDSIDLAPLRDLRRLRAVTLDGDFTNLDVLKTIPTLEFVGLSEEIWDEAPELAAAIQASLPKAAVVRVAPVCLGSGWILLIFPIALLVMLAAPRRRVA